MQLVLQPTACVKGSQKSLKDLLAMQQKQGSVLQIVSTFLINQLKKCWNFSKSVMIFCPVDTGRKLNVHKTFRRRPGRILNVLCTFNLHPVSTGWDYLIKKYKKLVIQAFSKSFDKFDNLPIVLFVGLILFFDPLVRIAVVKDSTRNSNTYHS